MRLPKREVHIAIKPVKLLVNRGGFGVRFHGTQWQANRGLRLFNRLIGARGQQREDARPKASRDPRRHKHRLVQHIGIHAIQHFALLRNPPRINHAINAHTVLRHALKNQPRMERGAFNRGEQLVLRGVHQIPAQRHAAQLRVHQHCPVAVVPCQAQQPRLPSLVAIEAFI